MQAYSDKSRESEPYSLPDVEVFWVEENEMESEEAGEYLPAGWYWWTCLPGCFPLEPNGPFDTEAEALEAAQDID